MSLKIFRVKNFKGAQAPKREFGVGAKREFLTFRSPVCGGKMFIEISQNLKKLSKYFPENLYVVGGYVRNKILNIDGGDVDLASSVDIEEVSKRLENSGYEVKVKSLKFGTLLILKDDESYEYTAFRKEVYDEGGAHCPIKIERTNKLEEDAIRRDFSVNAIYYNVNKDEIVDLFHGIVDLKQKILRATIKPDDIFKNDGERILRMVRFAGELNFKIDKDSLKSAQKYASNIKDLQNSRTYAEIEKILYCDKRYNDKGGLKRALKLLNKLKIWQYLNLKFKTVDYKMVFKCDDRLLGLLIDIVDKQKPYCLEAFLQDFLPNQFGFSKDQTNEVVHLLKGYYFALAKLSNKEYFFKFYREWSKIYPLLGAKSKHIQSKYNFFYQYIIKHGLVIETADLKITENDIKENFSSIDKRNYDKILKALLSKVFDGKLENSKVALCAEIEKNYKNF